jgi:hypothetical protein
MGKLRRRGKSFYSMNRLPFSKAASAVFFTFRGESFTSKISFGRFVPGYEQNENYGWQKA